MDNLTITKSQSLLDINQASTMLGEVLAVYRIQQNDKGSYRRGLISVSLGGQKQHVDFVWLAMSRSRILWPEYDPKEQNPQPLCKSLDGIKPVDGITMRPGPCELCEDSQWRCSKPPLCAEVFNMLCWDIEDQAPFVFPVKRTGIKALRLLKTIVQRGTLKFGHKGFPTHCAIKIRLIAKPELNYFVPEFFVVARNTLDETRWYAELANRLVHHFQATFDPEDSKDDIS